jgi:hypothetical protein
MVKKPPAPAPEQFIPVEGMVHAPIIYFEFCPTIGNSNGLINVMLASAIVEPRPNNRVATRVVAVAPCA